MPHYQHTDDRWCPRPTFWSNSSCTAFSQMIGGAQDPHFGAISVVQLFQCRVIGVTGGAGPLVSSICHHTLMIKVTRTTLGLCNNVHGKESHDRESQASVPVSDFFDTHDHNGSATKQWFKILHGHAVMGNAHHLYQIRACKSAKLSPT